MLPKIGTEIEVTVRNWTSLMAVPYPETSTFRGRVVAPFPWLDADTFCMTTGTAFVRSIPLSKVVSIRTAEGVAMPLAPVAPPLPNRSWKVEGSKGATYTVVREGNRWSCNCVAGQFKKVTCKHIKNVQAREG